MNALNVVDKEKRMGGGAVVGAVGTRKKIGTSAIKKRSKRVGKRKVNYKRNCTYRDSQTILKLAW